MSSNSNNKPDCAYFLLLGLCGAVFLLTIGGILTYVAFNPGSFEGHPHSALSHIPHFHHHLHQQPHPHPNITAEHHFYYQFHHRVLNASLAAALESKARQSLILAIIGPLCILFGIVVSLIVGILALKYDCERDPEPNISFLRLRSEMSLNYDLEKNNYELCRPSSSVNEAGGSFGGVNPTEAT